MNVRQAADEYAYSTLGFSLPAQRWYMQKLYVFVDWCEANGVQLGELKQSHIHRFLDTVRQRIDRYSGKPISSYTVHGYAQVVKRFLMWCTTEEGFEDEVNHKTATRMEMPRVSVTVIEAFSPEQLKAMFAAVGKEHNDTLRVRDRAILALLLDTGIRSHELVSLRMEHLYLELQSGYIKVYGKGDKWREIGLGRDARAALFRYVSRYRKTTDETRDKGIVFLGRTHQPLSDGGLHKIIEKIGERAGITGVRCSPHTFRHTFAVQFLQMTGDVYRLSRLMGHTSVKVTENYLRSWRYLGSTSDPVSVMDRLR